MNEFRTACSKDWSAGRASGCAFKNDAGHATMLAPSPYWLRYARLGGCRRRSCRELFQHHAPEITDIERARWQRFREDVRAQRLASDDRNESRPAVDEA